MMASFWKIFFYSPKKAEKVKEVHSVLNLAELKIEKPINARRQSPERCVEAIHEELPTLNLRSL